MPHWKWMSYQSLGSYPRARPFERSQCFLRPGVDGASLNFSIELLRHSRQTWVGSAGPAPALHWGRFFQLALRNHDLQGLDYTGLKPAVYSYNAFLPGMLATRPGFEPGPHGNHRSARRANVLRHEATTEGSC